MLSPILRALVVAVAAALGTTLAAPGAQAADTHTLGTFNMHGHVGNKGGTKVADAVVRSVKERKPLILALNEVCETQAEHIDEALSDYEIFFDPSLTEKEWDPEHETGPLCGSHDGRDDDKEAEFGNAVLYNTDVIGENPVSYGYKLSDQRKMACVFGEKTKLVACAVHLATTEKDRTAEAQRIHMIARDELRQEFPDAPTFDGHTRIVGGDFNGTPHDVFDDTTDYMYHRNYGLGAKGEFKEVDSPCGNTMDPLSAPQSYCRDGEATHGRWFPKKIDYIFVDPNVKVQWADATFSEDSDHDPLWASVTL